MIVVRIFKLYMKVETICQRNHVIHRQFDIRNMFYFQIYVISCLMTVEDQVFTNIP